jgi:phage shock protein PspC (stress-responsive transcriptional regulator)
MQSAQPSLFTRGDTILGACEGIGEDFGINAHFIRVGLAVMLFWSPVAALATYAALALAVFIARRLYPVATPAAASADSTPVPAAALHGQNDQPMELAAAA